MSSPKHLWSGDWERESAAISEELAGRQAPPSPAVDPPAPPVADRRPPAPPVANRRPPAKPALRPTLRRPGRRRRARPRLTPAVAVALAAVFVVAAAAYGLTRVVGSSSPGAPPSVSTAANGPGGPVEWLGMQVEGIPPGTVVVATVAPGSAGELAGLEPGDVIVSVNGRAINSTSDIGAAIGGLHPGDGVDVEVSRGSTQFATRATLTAPPSSHP